MWVSAANVFQETDNWTGTYFPILRLVSTIITTHLQMKKQRNRERTCLRSCNDQKMSELGFKTRPFSFTLLFNNFLAGIYETKGLNKEAWNTKTEKQVSSGCQGNQTPMSQLIIWPMNNQSKPEQVLRLQKTFSRR